MKILINISIFLFVLNSFSQNIAYTNETEIKNNLLYSNNILFTGTLYSSEDNVPNDCTCLLKAIYTNGKLNGLKKEYHDNGKLKYSAQYNNGILVGTENYYNKSGELISSLQTSNKGEGIVNSKIIKNWIQKADKYYKLKDYNHAFEYYMRAARQNNAVSQNMVGIMFEKGQSVIKSYKDAKEWYEKSAKQNNSDAQMNLAYLFFSAPTGITQDKILAEDLLTKSANSNNAKAQYLLGILYANTDGNGFIKDMNKATFWMQKAAESSYPKANEELAAMYYQKEEYGKALKYYTISAKAGNSRAQFVLGAMYRKGIGVKKSRKEAKKWFKQSCKNNYQDACKEIEKMNAFGNSLLNSVNESLKNKN